MRGGGASGAGLAPVAGEFTAVTKSVPLPISGVVRRKPATSIPDPSKGSDAPAWMQDDDDDFGDDFGALDDGDFN